MKNLFRVLVCISITLVAFNCSNDESMPAQGKVQFALAITSSSADGGRITSQDFPDGSYIALSIETPSGSSVYALEHIDLIQLGNGYITAPLELTEGSYRLTDFFVMSAGGEVLYATPKEGSPLAGLVDDPLPMNFSVTQDEIVNLNIQVVDAGQQSPEDFGYVSFNVEVVGSDFSIAVFTGENDNLSYTSAALRLYVGDELIHTQSLLAKVNSVNFKGDPGSTYTLVVEKEGYTIKTKEYTLDNLLDELDGSPLVVLLSPASTVTVLVNEPSVFGIHLTTGHDDIYVDWGDGTIEQISITSGYFAEVLHTYEETGRYHINITGNLASINEYYYTWIDYMVTSWQTIESIDITQLSELQQFQASWRTIPNEINFSHNPRLESLDLSYSTIHNLDISNNPRLKYINIETTFLTHENRSGMISFIGDLHTHVVARSIHDGLLAYYGIPFGDYPAETQGKMRSLKNDYGWSMYPVIN